MSDLVPEELLPDGLPPLDGDRPPVTIGLVRPDLMGTYGDGGNAIVLAQRLRWRGIPADVLPLMAGDPVPDSVKVMVVGGGEDAAQLTLLRDTALLAGVERAIERGASMLAVCAGLQVFGHQFGGSDGSPHQGVGLLDCTTGRLEHRAVGETVVNVGQVGPGALHGTQLTGFENHQGQTFPGPGATTLGRVSVGMGNGDGTDGVVCGKVIGTYLHGPALARNAALADLLLEWGVGPLPPLDAAYVDDLHRARIRVAATDRQALVTPTASGGRGRLLDAVRRRWIGRAASPADSSTGSRPTS